MTLATTTLLLGTSLACGRAAPSVHGSADTRALVAVPVDGYDAVLAEMRVLLGSLDGVLGGLTVGDTAAMRAAAAAAGTAEAADPALATLLPDGWKQLAQRTHVGFDSLAAVVARGAPRDSVIAYLAAVTPHCVSCHATYRLGVS
jgi:hypothetical protein